MNPRLSDLLRGEVPQGAPDLVLGEKIVPDPERAGAEFACRVCEQFAGLLRIGCLARRFVAHAQQSENREQIAKQGADPRSHAMSLNEGWPVSLDTRQFDC